MPETVALGVVGARGHTGAELLRLLATHPGVAVTYAASRSLAGESVPGFDDLIFSFPDPVGVADAGLDAVFLALPDGIGGPFVDALPAETVVVDISADHRLDDDWVYGLPELNRDKIAGARRIANPGCYATVMQLALAPFLDRIAGVPAVFGVSGYSGAGTTPSPRNDPDRLADNLMPYALTGHNHEREAARFLDHPIRFMPHVHPAFRGLLVTAHIPVDPPVTGDEARELLAVRYAAEPLVEVIGEIPELRDGAGLTGVLLGGVEVSDDGKSVVVVGVEDNLLKGAAVQAVQNLNLALGIPELAGITKPAG
ncbi:MAG TPA: N-acetyl-gamma-glutamyl-phosphate reductase [Acidimicrobiia bacterium]|nr:N-acetyl-gamma-glutamyl-phosphate reductase [Acidimicrobiia bacterium]